MQVGAYKRVLETSSTEIAIIRFLNQILAGDISNLDELRNGITDQITNIENRLEQSQQMIDQRGESYMRQSDLDKLRANVIQYLQEVVDEYNRLVAQQSPSKELVESEKFGLPPNLDFLAFNKTISIDDYKKYICQVCGKDLGKHNDWDCPTTKSRKIVKYREYRRVTDYMRDPANLTKLEDQIEDIYKKICDKLWKRPSEDEADYVEGYIDIIEGILNDEREKYPSMSTLSLIRSNIISYLGYVVEDIQARREARAPTQISSIFDLPRIDDTTGYKFLTNTDEGWWTLQRLRNEADWLKGKVIGPPGGREDDVSISPSREELTKDGIFGIWVKKYFKPKKLTEDEFLEQLKPFDPEEKLIEIAGKKLPLKLFEDYVNAVRAMRKAGFGGLLYGGQYFVPKDDRQLEIFEKYDSVRNEAHIAIKDYLGIKTFELPKIGTTGEIDQNAPETIEHDNFMKELDKAVLEQLTPPEEPMETIKEDKTKPTLDLNKYGIKQWGKIGQFDIWIVDGPKIKAELDSNWCGPEESDCYIAGHPAVRLFTFNVPENTIIVSTERETEKDIIASVSHEFVEFHLMRNGMKYESADQIARDVERLIVNLYENNFINKANWMTNMVDLASPKHFQTLTRRFPIHKEEEEKSVEQGLARVQQFIDKLTGISGPVIEGESYEAREAEQVKPFTALQSHAGG